MDAKLIVIGGKANKSEIKLKLPTTIGRSRKADLTIAHPKVSRQHCQIFERDGVLVVRDNGSLNGTLIDNDRITEAILKPGDKLTVGPLTFVAVYEHSGPLPPLPADLPTPAMEAIELPQVVAKVGRGPSKPVVAGPVKPAAAPKPKPEPIAPAEPTEVDEPEFTEAPQPPTVAAISPTPEAEDFSWLTGDTVPAPPGAVGKPPVAETVTMKLPTEPEPEAESEKLDLSAPAEAPPDAAEDFSWLDESQEQVPADAASEQDVDFAALEAAEPAPPEPIVKATSERTLVQEQGPTVIVPTRNLATTPGPENAGTELEPTAEPEKLDGVPQEDPAPAVPPVEAEVQVATNDAESELPDFGAIETSPQQEEPAFPLIVTVDEKSAPGPAVEPVHRPAPAARKGAEKKGWWPFGGKKKTPPAKPLPAAPPKASAEPAVEESTSPAVESTAPSAPPPQFVFPGVEPPVAEAHEPAPESPAEQDEALNDFFKKLQ